MGMTEGSDPCSSAWICGSHAFSAVRSPIGLLERLFGARKRLVLNMLAILADRMLNRATKIRELANKPWHVAAGHAEQVVGNQYLAITIGSSTDTDRRYGQLGRYFGRNLCGDTLQHNGKRTGILNGNGVGEQTWLITLHFIATHLMDVLGAQAHVGHHGNSRPR